jgi:hypothetical protein
VNTAGRSYAMWEGVVAVIRSNPSTLGAPPSDIDLFAPTVARSELRTAEREGTEPLSLCSGPPWSLLLEGARDQSPAVEPLDGGVSTHQWARAPTRGHAAAMVDLLIFHSSVGVELVFRATRSRERRKRINDARFWALAPKPGFVCPEMPDNRSMAMDDHHRPGRWWWPRWAHKFLGLGPQKRLRHEASFRVKRRPWADFLYGPLK